MAGITGCSGVWLKPSKYRNNEACDQADKLAAHQRPVSDRRGISMNKLLRTVEKQPVQEISIEVDDSSLGKAMPQDAAAIGEQIDRDGASDDFVKEELHANIRSSSTRPYCRQSAGLRQSLR
jgi:hypothetical protein